MFSLDNEFAATPQPYTRHMVQHSAGAISLGFLLALFVCAVNLSLHQRSGAQLFSGIFLGLGVAMLSGTKSGWRGGWITADLKLLYSPFLISSFCIFTGIGLAVTYLKTHPSVGFLLFFVLSALVAERCDVALSARSDAAWLRESFQFGIDVLFPSRLRSRLQTSAVVDITANGTGNGFLIRDDGIILTAAHVVGDRQDVWITLANGELFPGRVTHRDILCDCALVKVDVPYSLPVCRLGSVQKMRYGDTLFVLGWEPPDRRDYPAPLAGNQRLYVYLDEPSVVPMNVVQISYPPEKDHHVSLFTLSGSDVVRAGYSGGPACCPRTGGVLGMVCWGASDLKICLCVPADVLRAFLVRCEVRPRSIWLWQMPRRPGSIERQRNEVRLRCLNAFDQPDFGDLDAMKLWPHLQQQRVLMDEAVHTFPEFQEAWTARGWLRWAQGDSVGADEDAQEAMGLRYSILACNLRQRLAEERQHWDEAVLHAQLSYEQAPGGPDQKAQPERTHAVYGLALLFQLLGRHEAVVALCEKESVSDAYLLVLWAISLRLLDRSAESCDLMRGVIAREPGHEKARWSLLCTLADLGGQDHWKEMVQLGLTPPTDVYVLSLGYFAVLARAYRGLGLEDRAREAEALNALFEAKPDPK